MADLRKLYPSMYEKRPTAPRSAPQEQRMFPTPVDGSAPATNPTILKRRDSDPDRPWRRATEADARWFNAYPSLRDRYEVWMENPNEPLSGDIQYRVKNKETN